MLAAAAIAGSARGQPQAPLDWQAPPECDRTAFASRIPASAEAPTIHVHITRDPATARYEGTVRLGEAAATDADLSRTVGASSCKELSSALGLVAAMLLDDARVRTSPSRDAGAGDGAIADATPHAEPSIEDYDGGVRRARPAVDTEPGRSTWTALGVGATAVDGALAPEIRIGVHNGRAQPGLGVGLGVDGSLRGLDLSREGYELALRWFVLQPSLCATGVLALGHFEVGLCGAAEVGITWVSRIEGPLDAQTSQRAWFAAGALGRARYVSGGARDPLRFTLGLEASLLLSATRPTYRVEGGPALLRTPLSSPNLGIFAGMQFR